MTQTEYREMCRLEEEVRALRADNIVWSGQAIGFKAEADRWKDVLEKAIQFIDDHTSTEDADIFRHLAALPAPPQD